MIISNHKYNKYLSLAKDSRKLTFIYLVNDVIQNSRKKGPEFRDQFGPILAPALKLMAQAVNDEPTQKRLERILNIWGDRNMFDAKQISEFRKALGAVYISKCFPTTL